MTAIAQGNVKISKLLPSLTWSNYLLSGRTVLVQFHLPPLIHYSPSAASQKTEPCGRLSTGSLALCFLTGAVRREPCKEAADLGVERIWRLLVLLAPSLLGCLGWLHPSTHNHGSQCSQPSHSTCFCDHYQPLAPLWWEEVMQFAPLDAIVHYPLQFTTSCPHFLK